MRTQAGLFTISARMTKIVAYCTRARDEPNREHVLLINECCASMVLSN